MTSCLYFFFQAEDGIRDLVRSRGLGDVYKRQGRADPVAGAEPYPVGPAADPARIAGAVAGARPRRCLLYTSDAADDLLCVDLGGRRLIKKKKLYKRMSSTTDSTH